MKQGTVNILFRTAINEIKKQYLADDRPWIIGFSGGKDSTVVLQLTLYALKEIEKSRQHKPVYILSSDTLVEPPNIKDYLNSTFEAIKLHIEKDKLPIAVKIVMPNITDTFFVNLIGRGYPAPNRWFRWCTDRLKIRPSTELISNVVKKHGSVILLLGTRFSESNQRAATMKNRESNYRGLNPHTSLPSTFVYTPIAQWSNDDVWEYLLTTPPPWGQNHLFLLELYKQANSGECPLVVDRNTPSCGNSRFGCWVCTVVTIDRSMQGFVETGEEWMQPLLDFRNWLAKLRNEQGSRMTRKRDGRQGLGPFTAETRQLLLKRLFQIEKTVNMTLISDEELWHIQRIWAEEWDIFFTVFDIAQKHGRMLKMEKNEIFSDAELKALSKICKEEKIEIGIVRALLNIEHDYRFHARKYGIKRKLCDVLEKWTKEEVA